MVVRFDVDVRSTMTGVNSTFVLAPVKRTLFSALDRLHRIAPPRGSFRSTGLPLVLIL